MMHVSDHDAGPPERLEKYERLRALEDFETALVQQKRIPDADKLLARRGSFILHLACAAAIGLVVAVAAVLINFIVFTKVLHL